MLKSHTYFKVKKKKKKKIYLTFLILGPFYSKALGHGLFGLSLGPILLIWYSLIGVISSSFRYQGSFYYTLIIIDCWKNKLKKRVIFLARLFLLLLLLLLFFL